MYRIIKIGMDVHSTNYTLCAIEPVIVLMTEFLPIFRLLRIIKTSSCLRLHIDLSLQILEQTDRSRKRD